MHSTNVIALLALTFWTILIVELIGDKALYTVTSLATIYPARKVYTGISLAFAAKMLAAVAFGRILLSLPGTAIAALSGATLFLSAIVLWRKKASSLPVEPREALKSSGVLAAFAVVFFSEWADIGQASTAALVARYQMPLVVWAGATAALMTKGAMALAVGMQLRQRVPLPFLKLAAAASCAILGVIAFAEAFSR